MQEKYFDKREQIMFKENYDEKNYLNGLRAFDDITLDQLEQLLAQGFLNPQSSREGPPDPEAETIVGFIRKYPFVAAEGYAYSQDEFDNTDPDDWGIVLRGICFDKAGDALTDAFKEELQNTFTCGWDEEISENRVWLRFC